jgi:exodeoxyribonuclease VII large subunit
MRAVIWRNYREQIEEKLRDAGCKELLGAEQEICALSAIRFHPVYGLSLEICDVDPTFGVSLLERNRHEVLEKLQAANLLHLNKSLSLPAAALRIGLITASGSAAYADFTKTLLLSGFSFRVSVVHATMQGDSTEAQVVRALRMLERQDVDVICLVRGGGSPLDLASFDLEAIGKAIALCRKPVWVGIGHEIDVTVPDFVAHTSHKTPTAVAAALVERIQGLDARLLTSQERLEDVCQRTLILANRDVDRNENGLRQGVRKHMQLHETRFQGLEDRIRRSIRKRLSGEESQLINSQVRLEERIERALAGKNQTLDQSLLALSRGVKTRLTAAQKDIEHRVLRLRHMTRLVEQGLAALDERQRFLEAVNPERILARGYSLTRDAEGNIIKDAFKVEPGQIIHTQLSKGTLTSTVNSETQDLNDDETEPRRTDVRRERKTARRNPGAAGSLRDAHGRTGQ